MKLFDNKNDFTSSLKRALSEIDGGWQTYDGLIVPGSHAPSEIEEKIQAIKEARESGLPALCICLGHQLAAIEYARNVLGIEDATSEEFGDVGTYVVKSLGKLNVGLKNGESYWNNYEVALPGWEKPSHFITMQYHPEYQSSITSPHHDLVAFINLCKNR